MCRVYLDDIIIASVTIEEHTRDILEILQILRNKGQTIKISKCEFFVTEIKFLDHVISDKGISIDPDKVKAIRELRRLTDVKAIMRFLGSI